MNEDPFLVTQGGKYENKRVDKDDSFTGGTFDSKLFNIDLLEVR